MVPAGHAWQEVAVLDVNVPLPHAMHAVLASVLYEPLWHILQVVGLGEKKPAEHVRHELKPPVDV